jgi:hypothetical protein
VSSDLAAAARTAGAGCGRAAVPVGPAPERAKRAFGGRGVAIFMMRFNKVTLGFNRVLTDLYHWGLMV